MTGNLSLTKLNETDYTIPCELNSSKSCITHIKIENNSIYILNHRLGLEFAEFRENKIYIKVH